jgi:hypothetical protein
MLMAGVQAQGQRQAPFPVAGRWQFEAKALADTAQTSLLVMVVEMPGDLGGPYELNGRFLSLDDPCLLQKESRWWRTEYATGDTVRVTVPSLGYADCGLVFEGVFEGNVLRGFVRQAGVAWGPRFARFEARREQ